MHIDVFGPARRGGDAGEVVGVLRPDAGDPRCVRGCLSASNFLPPWQCCPESESRV